MRTRARLRRTARPLLAGSVVGVLLTVLPGRRRPRHEREAGLAAFGTAPCADRSAAELERDLEERASGARAARTPSGPESA